MFAFQVGECKTHIILSNINVSAENKIWHFNYQILIKNPLLTLNLSTYGGKLNTYTQKLFLKHLLVYDENNTCFTAGVLLHA